MSIAAFRGFCNRQYRAHEDQIGMIFAGGSVYALVTTVAMSVFKLSIFTACGSGALATGALAGGIYIIYSSYPMDRKKEKNRLETITIINDANRLLNTIKEGTITEKTMFNLGEALRKLYLGGDKIFNSTNPYLTCLVKDREQHLKNIEKATEFVQNQLDALLGIQKKNLPYNKICINAILLTGCVYYLGIFPALAFGVVGAIYQFESQKERALRLLAQIESKTRKFWGVEEEKGNESKHNAEYQLPDGFKKLIVELGVCLDGLGVSYNLAQLFSWKSDDILDQIEKIRGRINRN